MGSIIHRKDSQYLWIQYFKNGKRFMESAKTEKYTEAKRFLAEREGELAVGKTPTRSFDQIKFSEICDDFISDYRIKGNKSLAKAERNVKYLKGFFGNVSVTEVDTPFIRKYIESRDKALMSDATINRELAALKRAFHVALQSTPPKVQQVPFIPFKKEQNVRTEFFTHDQFLKLIAVLPDYLRTLTKLAYETGMRKDEVRSLKWEQVDPHAGSIDLTERDTKNKKPRKIFLSRELKSEIQKLWLNRKSDEDESRKPEYVFTHEDGSPIKDFRAAWDSACEKIGLPGRWFHDLRRCGVRNLRRSGVTEDVAMRISGQKTNSIFKRYNITDEDDLREAAKKRDAYIATVEQNLADRYVSATFSDSTREAINEKS